MGRQSTRRAYEVIVDQHDKDCLTLQGKEYWPENERDDQYASDDKSIAEIVVNAANYAAVKYQGYHFTHMDRVLWVEPRHPNPDLGDE